jgi:hypothetical protein
MTEPEIVIVDEGKGAASFAEDRLVLRATCCDGKAVIWSCTIGTDRRVLRRIVRRHGGRFSTAVRKPFRIYQWEATQVER